MRILNNTAIAEANGEERAFGPLPVIEMEMVNVDELGWRMSDDPGYDTMWTTKDVPHCVPALFKDYFTLIYDEEDNCDHLNYDVEITLPFAIPSGYYYIKNANDDNANLLYNVMIMEQWDNGDGSIGISITLSNICSHLDARFAGDLNPDGSITLYSD